MFHLVSECQVHLLFRSNQNQNSKCLSAVYNTYLSTRTMNLNEFTGVLRKNAVKAAKNGI